MLKNNSVLDKRYLLHGLNAMSRAHETDYFRGGHRAAATICVFYLCQENDVEDGVSAILAAMIDERWTQAELFAPFPDEAADPECVKRILGTMQDNMTGVRQAGHNVILPTLAIRALRDLPEAITASRADGICRLVRTFQPEDIAMDDNDDVIELEDPRSFAEFILAEFVACTERFEGRGQGWSGHLLTYGRALIDLRELGYIDLAKSAEEGFRMYVRRIRLGPLDEDKRRPEHSPIHVFPTQKRYWEQRGGDWSLGHAIKYPYGFYGLMNRARDTNIKEKCLAAAYRIL